MTGQLKQMFECQQEKWFNPNTIESSELIQIPVDCYYICTYNESLVGEQND